jgi:hypothetical protein
MSQERAVLLVWEDQYYDKLNRLIRRVRLDMGGPPRLVLISESAQGNGNFARYVTQRLVRRSPTGQPPPVFVIALADADRYATLVPRFQPPPDGRRDQARWSRQLRREWTTQLRQAAQAGGVAEPTRLFGLPLRWSRESVAIASLSALQEWAGTDIDPFLSKCKPDPRGLPSWDFAHTYRTPSNCLQSLAKTAKKRPFKKGADAEDILASLIENPSQRQEVLTRVPELRLLARCLNRIARHLEKEEGANR